MSRSDGSKEMGFFDHLETLRRGIIATLAAFVLAAFAFFSLMDSLLPSLLAPARTLGLALYAFSPYEKFVAYLKLSAVLGAGAALPLAAGLAAGFVAPALKPRARRSLAFATAALIVFFAIGAALAWFVVLPAAIKFFASFAAGDGVEPHWSLDSYVSLASGLLAAMGIVCILPPTLLAAMRLGIVEPSTLAKGRRYAIVVIALLAGILTPTVDAVTQCVLALAMWGLFELTLVVGRISAAARRRTVAVSMVKEASDG
jgi:sec-independent protein translocase protein TatC